jgi:FAD/FMN-containing dehydrogenase
VHNCGHVQRILVAAKGGSLMTAPDLPTSAGTNWAGNYAYRAARLVRPTSAQEVAALVSAGGPVRVLGSRHSFNDVADTTGTLVSLENVDPSIKIDEQGRTASFSAGIRYGELAEHLHAAGWAIHNLASLPHISVAGAVATATHGSGDANGNLATAVRSIEFVDGTGTLVRLSRGARRARYRHPDDAGYRADLRGTPGRVHRDDLGQPPGQL